MTTNFSGPINSTAGFIGDVTGNVTGDVTGDVTGAVVQAPTVYAVDGAVSPAIGVASLTKGTAGAYTLAAPGASNIGKHLLIYSGSAAAHVVTATGVTGGTTLTFAAAIGNAVELYAATATLWVITSIRNVTLA